MIKLEISSVSQYNFYVGFNLHVSFSWSYVTKCKSNKKCFKKFKDNNLKSLIRSYKLNAGRKSQNRWFRSLNV